MTIQVEQITKVTIDGVEYLVSEQSDTVKSLVAMYNDWREQEAKARSNLLMATTAIRTMGSEIVQAIKRDHEEQTPTDDTPEPVDSE